MAGERSDRLPGWVCNSRSRPSTVGQVTMVAVHAAFAPCLPLSDGPLRRLGGRGRSATAARARPGADSIRVFNWVALRLSLQVEADRWWRRPDLEPRAIVTRAERSSGGRHGTRSPGAQ